MASELVETRHGPVRGVGLTSGAICWRGLRYALCERWTAPEPLPDSFRYSEDCTKLAPAAAQPPLSMLPMTVSSPQAILGPAEQGFSEECLTLDVYRPSSYKEGQRLPVNVYLHGGFLNVGSPSCHFNEPSKVIGVDAPRIWVGVTYRLGVFGFLAAKEPHLSGNFGLLDQWQALLWVQKEISNFGGHPDDVTLMGQSAGAHSIQLHMHCASRLPDDQPMPFQRAIMISNGISVQPKSLQDAQLQFDALCAELKIDAHSADALAQLRKLDSKALTDACAALGGRGAFRTVTDGSFVASDLLEWQRSGQLASSLARKGFKRLVIGETINEDLGGSCPSLDFLKALARFTYGQRAGDIVVKHSGAHESMSADDLAKTARGILSSMQIYLGSRKLVEALWAEPRIEVIRYVIACASATAKAVFSPRSQVSHGTDLVLWFHRDEYMTAREADIAKRWRKAVADATRAPSARHHLVLLSIGAIGMEEDQRWQSMKELDRLLGT